MLAEHKKGNVYFNCLQIAKCLHENQLKIPEISEEFNSVYGVMLYFYESSRKNRLGCHNYYWGVDWNIYGYIIVVNNKTTKEFSKKYNALLQVSSRQPKYKEAVREIDTMLKEMPIQKLIESDDMYYEREKWLQCKYKRNRQKELRHIYIKGKDFIYEIWCDLMLAIIETMNYLKGLQTNIENLLRQAELEEKEQNYQKLA